MKIGPRIGSEFFVIGSAKGSPGTGKRLKLRDWAFLAQLWIRSATKDPVATIHNKLSS